MLSAQMVSQGRRIGFVPTMGCLHEGHLRLVDIAREASDCVVVSVFVNPSQFGPGEDFSRYPRTEEADVAACAGRGADLVFMPAAGEMFPADFSTYAGEELCSRGLCGEARPGHFRGVATVVLMLFQIVRPALAVFGQKDAQQVAVIRKMVRDWFLPVEIVVAPTVREVDGLALSSRNRYLSAEERAAAPGLFAALEAGRAAVASGERSAAVVCGRVRARIEGAKGFRVQYVAAVDAVTMAPVDGVTPGGTLLVAAAFLGAPRLIDNVLL
jgi:pantoate--beta-alanine ligase